MRASAASRRSRRRCGSRCRQRAGACRRCRAPPNSFSVSLPRRSPRPRARRVVVRAVHAGAVEERHVEHREEVGAWSSARRPTNGWSSPARRLDRRRAAGHQRLAVRLAVRAAALRRRAASSVPAAPRPGRVAVARARIELRVEQLARSSAGSDRPTARAAPSAWSCWRRRRARSSSTISAVSDRVAAQAAQAELEVVAEHGGCLRRCARVGRGHARRAVRDGLRLVRTEVGDLAVDDVHVALRARGELRIVRDHDDRGALALISSSSSMHAARHLRCRGCRSARRRAAGAACRPARARSRRAAAGRRTARPGSASCARPGRRAPARPRCAACARPRRSRGSAAARRRCRTGSRSGIRLKPWKMKPIFSLRSRERALSSRPLHVDAVERGTRRR